MANQRALEMEDESDEEEAEEETARAARAATDADGREFSNVPAPGVAPLVPDEPHVALGKNAAAAVRRLLGNAAPSLASVVDGAAPTAAPTGSPTEQTAAAGDQAWRWSLLDTGDLGLAKHGAVGAGSSVVSSRSPAGAAAR